MGREEVSFPLDLRSAIIARRVSSPQDCRPAHSWSDILRGYVKRWPPSRIHVDKMW